MVQLNLKNAGLFYDALWVGQVKYNGGVCGLETGCTGGGVDESCASIRHNAVPLMDAPKGVELGSDPLLYCVQQLHTAYSLQLLGDPVPETEGRSVGHENIYALWNLIPLVQ